MKKLVVLAMCLLCTCICVSEASAANNLIADLEAGTLSSALGSLKVGQPCPGDKAVSNALGEEPDYISKTGPGTEEVDWWEYGSSSLGVNLEFTLWPNGNELSNIVLTLVDEYDEGKLYKAFSGTLRPSIPEGASIDTIIRIFGTPDADYSIYESIPNPSIYYYKSYGDLAFFFDKNSKLEAIMMGEEAY